MHFAGAAALCIGWASLGVLLGYLLGRFPAGNYISWLLTTIPWSVFMYFTVLGCVHAFAYFVEAREREAQAPALRRSSPRRGSARCACSCTRTFCSTA